MALLAALTARPRETLENACLARHAAMGQSYRTPCSGPLHVP